MKIYDISQEVFSCQVYPGDTVPEKTAVKTITEDNIYNLTDFRMCAHNGTHVDAPYHFFRDGKTVEQISPEHFTGKCYVSFHEGDFTAADAEALLKKARCADPESARRLLLGGSVCVTLEAAKVLAQSGILLIGNESQTVGPEEAPAAVHYALLGAEVVLLEGIRLNCVPEGVYLLSAAPLKLAGCDGAPCRAILIKE